MKTFLAVLSLLISSSPVSAHDRDHGANEKPTLYDVNRARVWEKEEECYYEYSGDCPCNSPYNQYHDNPPKY